MSNRVVPVGLIFSFLVFMAGCSCSPASRSQTSTNGDVPAFFYYKQAMDKIEHHDFEGALGYMDTAIVLKPEVAQFYYARGQILEILDQPSAAILAYEKALNLKSYYPDAWKRLARLYLKAGFYDKSVQILRSLTDAEPDSLQYQLLLADAYLGANKPQLALERVSYFEKRGQSSPETYRLRGIAYFLQKNYTLAIQFFTEYIRYLPESFRAQKLLGISYLNIHDWETGIYHLNQALKINPKDPEIFLYRAKYFVQMNKPEAAADQYTQALQLNDTDSRVLLETGKFHLLLGDTLVAGQMLQKALISDEACWECYKLLGVIADEQGRNQEALRYLQIYLANIFHRDSDIEKRVESLRQSQNRK